MKMYKQTLHCDKETTGIQLRQIITKMGYLQDFYILCNGKRIEDDTIVKDNTIHIIPRLPGGKGGFGSMLRAIGAQIEKTTNREACRDLSGRRLRDINEEKRLKNWINQQAEREKEAKERRQKKLERLCERPRHEFKDEEYDRERSSLPEKVEDAVMKGLEASCSTKRKSDEKIDVVKKKKPRLWVDDELDEDVSSSNEGSDEEHGSPSDKSPEKEENSSESSNTIPDGINKKITSDKEKETPGSTSEKNKLVEDNSETQMAENTKVTQ